MMMMTFSTINKQYYILYLEKNGKEKPCNLKWNRIFIIKDKKKPTWNNEINRDLQNSKSVDISE